MVLQKQLPEGSRKALVYIADQLRRGYTGTFEINCSQGGITAIVKTERLVPKDLPPSSGTPS